VARLLLLAIALLGLAASLAVLGFESYPGAAAWVAHALNAGAGGSVRSALIVASLVAVASMPLGLLFALGLRGGGAVARAGALACCAVLVLVWHPDVAALPKAVFDENAMSLTCAIAQASSVVTLFLLVSGGPVPARLITAARAAGARRIQAWRHAILAPLAWPLLFAAVAAFVVGLLDGPLHVASPDDPVIFRFWAEIAALLLVIGSLAALVAAMRRRPA